MEPKPGTQYSTNPTPVLSEELTPQLIELIKAGLQEIKTTTGHGHVALVVIDRRVRYVKVEKSFEAE